MEKLLYNGKGNTIFHIPDGLQDLLMDISREVLREQPIKMYEFIADYLSALLITRENMAVASRVLDNICEYQPNTINELTGIGLDMEQAEKIDKLLHSYFSKSKGTTLAEGKILKIIFCKTNVSEDKIEELCQIVRRAYLVFVHKNSLSTPKMNCLYEGGDAVSKAVNHTINIIAKSNATPAELNRAAIVIQVAYRSYIKRRRENERQKIEVKETASAVQRLFEPEILFMRSTVKDKDVCVSAWLDDSCLAHMYDK